MKARLGAGRANLQRADNQIDRHDVTDVPDDRAQVEHFMELEPAGHGVGSAQREAHGAGDVRGASARDEYGWRGADRGSRPKLRDKRHRCQSEHDVHGGEHPIRGSQPDDMQYRAMAAVTQITVRYGRRVPGSSAKSTGVLVPAIMRKIFE